MKRKFTVVLVVGLIGAIGAFGASASATDPATPAAITPSGTIVIMPQHNPTPGEALAPGGWNNQPQPGQLLLADVHPGQAICIHHQPEQGSVDQRKKAEVLSIGHPRWYNEVTIRREGLDSVETEAAVGYSLEPDADGVYSSTWLTDGEC